jgi:hypothetical protein
MKTAVTRLYHRFDREVIEHQIEEELRFHLEMLTQQHLQQNMPLTEAQDAALKRFGNVELIKDQCVQISRRNRPLIRALKSFLILVFLVGVLLRVFGTELGVTRAGDVLIAIALLGRLFFYVRGLNPARFAPKDEPASSLMLNDGLASFTAYDQRRRTPLERVISDSDS